MKEFSTKFQKSILFFIKMLMYALSLGTFFVLFSIDNPEIIDLSRTAAVTLSTFVITLVLLSNIYGGYEIGSKRKREIYISLILTGVITDLITYFELTIMKTNEANNATFTIENVGILFLVIIIQSILFIIFTIIGDNFYFWINEAEKCLIITDGDEGAKRVAVAMSLFKSKYKINEIAGYLDEDLEDKMLLADTIVMYEIPIEERTAIIDFCYRNLKNIYFNPKISDIIEQAGKTAIIDDIPFFSWQFHVLTFEQRIAKRIMDIIISLIVLIITSPVFLVSAVLIKKYDGGKVFFKQKRATVNGKVFEIYKFRTMKENVENKSTFVGDDRITPIGKKLRKYRIDELPQLVNIIKGDMSLVGPRPEMLENVDEYTKNLPEFVYRLRMKAGLTGYAQIIGKYNTSSRDKLMLDLLYIENYSLLKDIQLLFRTVLVIFKAEDSTQAFAGSMKNNGTENNG